MPPKASSTIFGTKAPPQETVELRRGLRRFLDQPLAEFVDCAPTRKNGTSISIGAVKWGAYAFLDYEHEPIYVGQTRESLGSRIGRHLTNQRTDAVAMSVLDPFEVRFIKVWPLPQYQQVKGEGADAREAVDRLNSVERTVFLELVRESRFHRVLNEKDPPDVSQCDLPVCIEGEIVPAEVLEVRQHPDTRIARRAQTLARLSAIIAGREVAGGLRRALLTQAQRLAWLADQRFGGLGGEALVEHRREDEPPERDVGEGETEEA